MTSKNIPERIEKLIEEGNSFNPHDFYKNILFGAKYYHREDYGKWKGRVEYFLTSNFGISSSVYESFKEGEEIFDIEKDYEKGHTFIMRSLQAAYISCIYPKEKESIKAISNIKIKKEDAFSIIENKLFILHVGDENFTDKLKEFLTALGIGYIILNKKPNDQLTIIEKCEKYKNVEYAIVILTPDTISSSEEKISDEKRYKEKHALQKTIWEFGYLVGKFGCKKVCCFYADNATIPVHIPGMLYKEIENGFDDVKFLLMSELKTSGFNLTDRENEIDKSSRRNDKEVRRKLDEDYIENKITREEYLKKKKGLAE
jgi:predicted nucleotide-binding protein